MPDEISVGAVGEVDDDLLLGAGCTTEVANTRVLLATGRVHLAAPTAASFDGGAHRPSRTARLHTGSEPADLKSRISHWALINCVCAASRWTGGYYTNFRDRDPG